MHKRIDGADGDEAPFDLTEADLDVLGAEDAPHGVLTALAAPPAPSGSDALVPAPDPFREGARAVEAYLRAQLSPKSRVNARDALKRLARVMLRRKDATPDEIPWPAIGYEQATAIRTVLYEMTRTNALTPGSANLTLSHVRGLLRTMYGMGIIGAAQHELVHSGALKNVPGTRKARGRALSAQDERELRAAARGLDGYRGLMLDTAIVLAIGAGLRREEVAKLTLEGFGVGELQVLGKGNKERRMPVDAQMQAAADVWLEERRKLAPEHGGLFCAPSRPEFVLSPWAFWELVRTAAHAAFGDRRPCAKECRCFAVVTGPHDFRRTFATRLLDQGFDIRQVQRLMNHESIETTARYDHREEEALVQKRRATRVIA